MVRRPHRLAAALVMLAVLSGCGAASERERGEPAAADDSAATPDPAARRPANGAQAATRAAFVADARAICGAMNRRVLAFERKRSREASAADLERLLRMWDAAVVRLRKLAPPREDAAAIATMLDHFEHAIVAGRALQGAEGEMALVPVAAMAERGAKGAAIAARYGLATCSLIPPPPRRPRADREPIRHAARALVPGDARMLETRDSACDAGETGPSPCSVIFSLDMRPLTVEERVAALRSRGAERGWRIADVSRYAGNAAVTLKRNDYIATFELPSDERLRDCGTDRSPRICTDWLIVRRWQTPLDDVTASGLPHTALTQPLPRLGP